MSDDLDILDDLLRRARKAGADAADAALLRGVSLSHAQRLGKPETLEREEGQDLGLRVLVGQRQAIVSTTDLNAEGMQDLVERAIAMARVVPEDPYCGLADASDISPGGRAGDAGLELCDPDEPAPNTLIERARLCEEAARAVTGVTNSEGAEAGWSHSQVALAASNGFAGAYGLSRHSLGVSVIAGEGAHMQRDYDYSSAVFAQDLETPDAIGRRAGERAVKRLNPRKQKTCRVPVVFDPRTANSFLRHFAGAINGQAIARGTSFLRDTLGDEVFGAAINIMDDPLRPRGLRSRPFDGEGLAATPRRLVEAGRLQTWILDLASARQLKLASTGHASRGVSSPPSPSPSNLYLEAGDRSPEALIGDIEEGFYVTDMIGMGVNAVTGDYSRGASGFWISKGELGEAVSEMTVAGNLKDIFRHATPANDLTFRYGTDSPTLLVEGLTVAGA